ncbi:phytanoyl-CoA dioxygenase family protein [Pseudaestuariivita sp.]|uniref:phytanoyl-CoA dioxygenase family protein n=1 Tax=Pseudaestuariivita sp. TaxID=2211669 RepID=UPI0040585894
MRSDALDLSFKPGLPGLARTLTPADVAHYNLEGYVQPFDALSTGEVAALRAQVDRWMADLGEAGAYGINCYQARLAGLWDIANHPRILDLVQDIIGPDILCWASAILSKRPHDPKAVPWHQDASFWSLSPARTVTVWLAIDDADADNSAMQFIPRSHDQGVIAETEMGEGSVFHKGIAITDAMGDPFTNALKAGQVSLHADMLVHGSVANRSDRRRCGLTLRYCPPEVQITDQGWAKGVEAILCRGVDRSGRWVHHPRPENNDITQTSSPHVVGNN